MLILNQKNHARINIGRKHYDEKATIENSTRNRFYYSCICSITGNDVKFIRDEMKAKESNINFMFFPSEISDSTGNNKPYSTFAQYYILHCSHMLTITALDSIFKNTGNPYMYKLYCDAVASANSYGLKVDITTEVKEHTKKKTASGKMVQCKPYYTLKVIDTELIELNNTLVEIKATGIEEDSAVQDLISTANLTICALYNAGYIQNFSDIWQNAKTIYRAVNRYIRNERNMNEQTAQFDDFQLVENADENDKKDIMRLWENFKPVLHTALVQGSKHTKPEKADMILHIFGLRLEGYKQEEIAKILSKETCDNFSRDKVARLLKIFETYVSNSAEVANLLKSDIVYYDNEHIFRPVEIKAI